jgi:hypothetical protein
MTKCPFCHFENEEGSLFCEQCKSDLGSAVATAAPAMPVAHAEAFEEAHPVDTLPQEAIPVAAPEPAPEAHPVAEAVPVVAAADIQPVVPTPVPPTASGTAPPAPAPVAEPPTAHPAGGAETFPAPPAGFPADAQPRLLVLRGQKRNVEYPIYDGLNFIGRADEEPPDRIWCSRQHACISFENAQMAIEDLNSSNGTFVNRTRIYPGQKRPLTVNDIIQIGNVQLKVIV